MKLTALCIAAYLVGSINPAYLFTRWKKGVDIRECGTGNAGATNAMFSLGMKLAIVIMLLDVTKAALCVTAARLLLPKLACAGAAAGLSCMVGHVLPAWLHFRGGKGTACMCGIILALTPALVLPLLALMIPLMLWSHRKNFFGRMEETPFRTMLFHRDLDHCVEQRESDDRS